MPRHCTVCDHPQRDKINELLVEGKPYRYISLQYHISEMALSHHKSHLNNHLLKAKEAQEVAQADNLLDQVRDLQQKALSILSKAEAEKDYRAATSAIREARGCLELLAKLLGELNDRPQINILVAPEWITLRTVILQSLEPFPDARISVSKALESLSNGSHSA